METNHLSISTLRNDKKSIRSIVSSIYVISTLFLLGIVFRKQYEDLFLVKYVYYYTTSLTMITILSIISLLRLLKYTERTFISVSVWKCALSLFIIICIISTIQSDYTYEAFWGNEGRYNGLFLMLLYCLSTLFIGEYLDMKQWYLDVFLYSGLLINLVGIGDYFKLNILHFKNLSDRGADIFTSTIGNINFYTAYVALTLGCAAGLFVIEKNTKRCIAYYVCYVVAFTAIIMGASDNAYISIITILGLLPLFTLKTHKSLNRNLILVASSASLFKLIAIINTVFRYRVVEIDGLLPLIGNHKWLWWVILFLWGSVLYLTVSNTTRTDITENKALSYCRYIWVLTIFIAILLVFLILWDVNINHNLVRYGSLENYLFFDDDWGTNRGFAWRIAWEHFLSFPIQRKIFGYGLDTFGILTIYNNKREMLIGLGSYYDSIHNEYLQYLVTIGLAGLASYITFLIVAVRSMVKNLNKTPYLLGIILAVSAYCAQAVVNINQVPVTPLMWCLIAVGMAACRTDK